MEPAQARESGFVGKEMPDETCAGATNARTDGDVPTSKKPDVAGIGEIRARAVEHLFDIRQLHFRDFARDRGLNGRVMTDGGVEIDSDPIDGESYDGDGGVRPVPAHVDPPIRTNGGARRFPELVDFRRDILLTLARSGPTHGQGLKDDLACLRDEDVNDGRLYPNLNALVDDGLVEKHENRHDERSHEFELSKRGRASVREHAQRVTGAVDALDGGER